VGSLPSDLSSECLFEDKPHVKGGCHALRGWCHAVMGGYHAIWE
jgi:hypothetical protein